MHTLLITYRNKYHYFTALYLRYRFNIARNIDETLTYNSVGFTTPNFNFLVIFEKNMRKSLKTRTKF